MWFFRKTYLEESSPLDTGRKLNVHKTFRRRPRDILNDLYTFNLRLESRGLVKKLTDLTVP